MSAAGGVLVAADGEVFAPPVGGFVLVGGSPAESFLDAAGVVEAVDVFEQLAVGVGPGGQLTAADPFCFDDAPRVLRERVVEAVADGDHARRTSSRSWDTEESAAIRDVETPWEPLSKPTVLQSTCFPENQSVGSFSAIVCQPISCKIARAVRTNRFCVPGSRSNCTMISSRIEATRKAIE